MHRKDPPVNPLLGKTFLESLRQEFPEEYSKEPRTLRQELKYLDEILGIEEHFLDNIDSSLESLNTEEVIPKLRKTIFKGRRVAQELNFDTTDYRRLSETDEVD